MGQIGINRMTTKLTPCVSSYYTEPNIFYFKSCIFVHPHNLEIIRTILTKSNTISVTYRGNNAEWLDSVSLTSIINVCIGSGGSGCVSRIWQSQNGIIDMLRYNIMWCYMLITLTDDEIKKNKKKNLRHCQIDSIALKEGGGGTIMTLLIWMTWCKKDIIQCVSNGVTSFLY